MMELVRKHYNFIVFIIILIYLVTAFIQMSLVTEGRFTDGQTLKDIQNEWTDENGEAADISELEKLPDVNGDGRVSIYYDVPEMIGEDMNLMFMASNIYVDCFVVSENDHVLRGLGSLDGPRVSSVGKSYGTAFCGYPVSHSLEGMRIRLDVERIYDNSGRITGMKLGSMGAYITEYINDRMLSLQISIVTIIIGLMLSMAALAIQSDKNLRSSLCSFIMSSLFIGLWGIGETHVLLLLRGNANLWRISDYLVLVILPYMFICAVNGILRKPRQLYRDIAAGIFIMEVAVIGIGWIAFGKDFHSFKPLIHGMLLVGFAVIVYMTFTDERKAREEDPDQKNGRRNHVIFSEILFIVCCLADLYRHYYTNFMPDDTIFIMRVGFLVFELAMFFRYAQLFRDNMKQVAELEIYQKLAYTDELTGLGNRNAFLREEEMLAERLRSEDNLVIVACSFDMNYLKRMNDTYGHVTGDRYLKAAADAIRRSFGPEASIFRCGGDEFAAFLCGDEAEIRMIECLEKMETEIAKINRDKNNFPEPLSISYGYARTEGSLADLEECEVRADMMMYDMKRRHNEQRDEER